MPSQIQIPHPCCARVGNPPFDATIAKPPIYKGSKMESLPVSPQILTVPFLTSFAQTMPFSNPSTRAYLLAGIIVRHFLGEAWIETNIMGEKGPTEFFRNDWGTSERRDVAIRRVIEFGEMLFNLQGAPGFEKCRFQLRDNLGIEGTFAEFEVGKLLQIHGMRFRFVVPQNELGMDYDLEVIMSDGRRAFADTKCKIESTSFTASTIEASLKKARRQLPADTPGMIFLKVPETWLKTENEWTVNGRSHDIIESAILSFLRNTRRIVSVKVYATIIHLEGTNSLQFYQLKEFDNPLAQFAGDWEIFKDISLHGTGPRWVDLISVANPASNPTHTGVLPAGPLTQT